MAALSVRGLRKRFGSTELASTAIGFTAAVELHEGLARTIAWTRANLPLIEACVAQHRPYIEAKAA